MKLLIVGLVMSLAGITASFPVNNTEGDSGVESIQAQSSEEFPQFLSLAIKWLADAQYENGGWGAGQHAMQNVTDPRAVSIDPATTAFSAMALMRAGSTLHSGTYSRHVRKALNQILMIIENSSDDALNITNVRGTQPQRKLGQNIDVAMASQFLTKIRADVTDQILGQRIDRAIDKCITKIERAQNENGSFQNGGWAPVLQSAMATNALEIAEVRGYAVDGATMTKAKRYQQQNVDLDGGARVSEAAGIPLYTLASTQRATAADAVLVEAAFKGQLDLLDQMDAPEFNAIVVEQLMTKGKSEKEAKYLAKAYVANKTSSQRLNDEAVWRGFGNNGGEEFLSYMMTSESVVRQGADVWEKWYEKLVQNFENIQNSDGSWSGHHCITSPVFCTAAVILSVTADLDPDLVATGNER